MLKGLSDKLRQSIEKITKLGIVDKDAVEELVREMQRSLLSADVDVSLVFRLSESIKKRALENLPPGLTRKEHVIKVVYEELTNIMGGEKTAVSLTNKKILLCGLYGSGKTSTAAKLARFYQKKGLKPMLICCDVVRPAAYEQLQQLAARIEVPFYGEKGQKNASSVLKNALKKVQGDVIIVDSSGRNALERELIDEIKGLDSLLSRHDNREYEKILVIPADMGQAAKVQANAFHSALGITDVIVTKLDATAKGGGALTACSATGAKVKFITAGETIEDLQNYDPEKFVARLIGFADLETLLEKARSVVDEDKAKKVMKGDFDLEDFYSQIESMQKMGPLSQIMDMAGLGRLASKAGGNLNVQEQKMKKWKYILQSMTTEEKRNPDVLNSSRIRRIAGGSGMQESDVREFISNYSKMKKVMKKMSPGKMRRGDMSNLFRQIGMK
jgi:signal recognition particle subunit SRP54